MRTTRTAVSVAVVLAGLVTAAPAADAATTKAVAMTNANTFSPAKITIGPGTVVVWKNSSRVTHTTTKSGLWTRTVPPGGTFRRTFSRTGTFSYVCTIHPGMAGTVVVR